MTPHVLFRPDQSVKWPKQCVSKLSSEQANHCANNFCFMFMREPRKGGEIPNLHYAISRLRKFQDCMEHICSAQFVKFAQFRNCTAQIRNFQFAQLFINCAKHRAICELPTHGASVREGGKRTLVVSTEV